MRAAWSAALAPRQTRPPALAVPLAAALVAAAPTEAAPGADWPLDASDVPPPAVRFVTDNSSIVTAQTGSTALIPCVVSNLGDGMVSWIRRKDYHLLTVGLVTYTGDDRYQAIHVQHSEDWTLQIKYVQQRDAGLYECQVSSHPPTSIFIDLRVVEARAEIAGPSEKYLKLGSALRLVCTVRQSTEPPVYVFWYHNNRMVNYDADRGINVTTDRPAKSSTLLVPSAAREHSGNYSCVPNDAQPASTYVHILNGENPAAMQHGGRALSWLRCPSAWLLLASIAAALCAGPAAVLGADP
ncbi:zwei Ig domain protein zig-8-like [Schistocerca serialis cubense]|uniref:zwei Ig domain protein zig-8-like n=1 Tax=Schistocerca serialis cubense TaxID=2023355 RepID=UPI00214E8DD3|nr:zwei Ig domain protein zig-8-like [Schistocerca serialis cubense]